ncbi:LuxR C-terminal-related transcriptional regulator [Occultella gossypii]|uniref:LuxR family transcriptional regulator n=1 Tax=Occultella gossypii TaxID=2800820 RepID=A0ABS7S9R4_9MICO|nr:LuxR C-terminal-related transcriptional regulator [Occultella gossypii]MBZ2197084.1 LuxR family transcriptional regulator [Occultella gossypii]
MSQEPGTAARGGLERLLHEAKLDVPRRPVAAVSRAGLIDAAIRSGRRVVSVTAPAGYGKSTLLAQWAHRDDRAVAWVSLDSWDDDPLSLLIMLASAFTTLDDAPPDLVQDMIRAGPSVLGRAAPRLAAAIANLSEPFLLLLDDLQVVRSPACHDVLGLVIDAVPPGSQVVIASRSVQPHLPRLRAQASTVEIAAQDLALDVAGAEQIFATTQVAPSREVLEAVTERTEGWPVGIYLAALIARHDSDEAAMVSGEDPYVADYLQREAYLRLPAETRRFLRRTALLEHLSAPLCDAVLGGHDARRMLRQFEASSLFLVPLDRHREWFRYHALFREFLLGELMTAEPDLSDTLRLRAADWYEAHGLPHRAVEVLLPTPHRERCIRLVTRIVMSLFQSGRLSTVERWLGVLGADAIAGYPPLAVLAGYVAVYQGHAAEAERWGAVVERASFEGESLDGTASFASARAMYRATRCPQGPEQMLADARLAIESEPPLSVWRDTALALGGEAALLVGDVAAATDHFTSAVAAADDVGNADTLALSEGRLAQLAMDAGSWEDARLRVAHALREIATHRMDDYPTSAPVFAAAARLAVHDGDLTTARRELTRGMRVRVSCTYAFPTLAVRTRLNFARTSWALGDNAAVRHLLREIDDVMLHRPDLGVLGDEVLEFRRDFEAGPTSATSDGRTSPLSPAELRLLPYLQTYLTIREIAERLFISRNTASTEIGAIYRKLGVSSRGDAVRQAIARGLLGE